MQLHTLLTTPLNYLNVLVLFFCGVFCSCLLKDLGQHASGGVKEIGSPDQMAKQQVWIVFHERHLSQVGFNLGIFNSQSLW